MIVATSRAAVSQSDRGDLSRETSVIANHDRLARAQSRGQLDFFAHPLGRVGDEQTALVVVAHLEHFRRRLLASHISLAKLLIDNHLHRNLLTPSPRAYKRSIHATRIECFTANESGLRVCRQSSRTVVTGFCTLLVNRIINMLMR